MVRFFAFFTFFHLSLTFFRPEVPFKLACLVLHMVVKEFFKTPSKNGEIGRFNLEGQF